MEVHSVPLAMWWSSDFGWSRLGRSCLLPGNDFPLGQYSRGKVEGLLPPFSFGLEVFCPLKCPLAWVDLHVVWHWLLSHHFATGGAGSLLAFVLLLLVVIHALLGFEELLTVWAGNGLFSCTLYSPLVFPQQMGCIKHFVAKCTFELYFLPRLGNKLFFVFPDSVWC